MRDFSISIDIDAAPRHVWAVMRDVERWHEWTSTIRSITRLDSGPFGVGAAVRIRQPGFPAADWRVTRLEEGRGFSWKTTAPGLAVTGNHWVEPREGISRATLSLQFEGPLGPLWGWLTRKVNDRYLGIEAAGLKRRSESQGAEQGARHA